MTVDIEDIRAAQDIIRPHLHRTPTLHSTALSHKIGTDLWLKAENLQKTGSFKPRGAINAVSRLTAEESSRGIIAVSAGNHGQAVAFAGRIAGIPATVVVPDTAPAAKIAAIEGYGGRPVLAEPDRILEVMEDLQRKQGQIFIHPFDNPHVIAGAGTVGLEILEDVPDVQVIVAGVGGGGLVAGVASAVKALRPNILVIGVEPETSNIVSQSLAAGEPLHRTGLTTIADGLNPPFTAATALGIIQRLVDEVVTVSDAEIARAMALIMERTKMVVEPAGAAAMAALLAGKVPQADGKRSVAILSGGNFDLSRMGDFLAMGSAMADSS